VTAETPADDDTDRSALETERDFLLRSLDDLDNERRAGNIDDGTYERLHADYTARAAAVLRKLRDGLDVDVPSAAPARGRRRWLAPVAIGLVAVVAALLLAQSVHDRSDGASITGNDLGAQSTKDRKAALEQAVKDHPDDYDAHIALARFLLNNDLRNALVEYDEAATLEPKEPEPLAYSGWINALAAGNIPTGEKDRDLLVQRAYDRFDRAIEIAPKYADTFVFRGITSMQLMSDPQRAIPDFQRFLQLAPQDHPQRDMVLSALAQAETAAKAKSTASTTVPPTTTTP
jgi:cytochrome c-type biogenesis protein CcmH/NrfG